MKNDAEIDFFYKELVYEDVVFLYHDMIDIQTKHFFFYINQNSPLGISNSDAASFFEEQAGLYTFIGIYAYGVDTPFMMLKFSDLNPIDPFLNLSIVIVNEIEERLMLEAIRKVIRDYFTGQQTKKIVCVVLSNEVIEIKYLNLLMFNHEVSYPQYYYAGNKYIDIEIYGLLIREIKTCYI